MRTNQKMQKHYLTNQTLQFPAAIVVDIQLKMMASFSSALAFSNLNSCNHPRCSSIKRDTPFEAAVAATTPEYLQSKFRRSGVSFTGIGDSCVVGFELENGTSAKLMLPSGLITSFKPQMWHGATMELLHTSVSETDNSALIQGGLSLALACQNHDAGGNISWSPNFWALHQLTGTRQESFQVELVSTSEEGLVEIKHTITLKQDLLNSEILVSNSTTSPLHLGGSTLCHLAVSTPDATYAVGLEGSDYFGRPPFQGYFSIIPPDINRNPNRFWPFNNIFDNVSVDEDDINTEMEGGEEADNYKHLTQNLSRIYTSAPRSLTIIDRGRRNSVTVRRQGFEELYIFSPGSEHEYYGKYSYICIGHAAQLQPIILNAQSQWRGQVQLFNPNY